jgi:serine/threonine-protein kinase
VAAIIARATRFSRSERYLTAGELAKEAGRALAQRLQQDTRSMMEEWLAPFAPKEPATKAALSDRLDLELILAEPPPPAVSPSSSQSDTPRVLDVPHYHTVRADRPIPLEATLVEPGLSSPKEPVMEETHTAPAFGPLAGRDTLLGATVESYRVETLIGRGGWSRVYRAKQVQSGREIALKVMNAREVGNDNTARRMRQEAEILGRLAHPNIVGVIGSGQLADGRSYLMLELVPGPTLGQRMREGAMPSDRVARIALGIARGLVAAHEAGVLHRDLKPANVKLVAEVEPKILDFGIARLDGGAPITRLTAPGQILGTPAFMPPERIAGNDSGARADLYALGVIIHEMLTGKHLFTGTLSQVIEAKLEHRIPPPPAAGGLGELATWLLARDPAARPESARLVVSALEGMLERTAPIAEPPATETRVTQVEARMLSAAGRVVSVREVAAVPWRGIGIGIALVVLAAATTVAVLGIRGRSASTPSPRDAEHEAPVAVKGVPTSSSAAHRPPPPPAPIAPREATPSNERPAERAIAPKPPRHPAPGPAAAPLSAPAPKRSADETALRGELAGLLSQRGLTRADLDGREEWGAALARFDTALGADDPAGARSALGAIRSSLLQFHADPPLLKRKLARIGAAIEKRVPEAEREVLERRYLDLREQIRPGLSESRAEQLLTAASALEAEVKR